MRQRVTIVGAGNLGIACAARLAARGVSAMLFTRKPELWSNVVTAEDCKGCRFKGELVSVSSDSNQAADTDLVLLCVPGNVIAEKLALLKPHLNRRVPVVSIYSGDGFFFVAKEILGVDWPVAGFQRVPFICRMKKPYGQVEITGYKKELFLAHRNISDPDSLRMFFQEMFDTKTALLSNFYEAAFVNSNVILHPARLMSLQTEIDLKGPFTRVPMFYEEWDDVASEWAIRLDNELRAVAAAMGATIKPFLEYYESIDVPSLSRKIRSIPAFKGIGSPISQDGRLDLTSRYVQADVLIALSSVVRLSEAEGLEASASKIVLERFLNKVHFASSDMNYDSSIHE